jgi:hypothetical protein
MAESDTTLHSQAISSRASRGEFDFERENAKLRRMTDIQLREHGQECGRQVDAMLKTMSGSRHADYRYELAKEEFRRRQAERNYKRSA